MDEKESHRERGRQLIASAGGVMHDFRTALLRQDWNIAVRRAQEAVELFVKGTIWSMGAEARRGHKEEPVKQLRELVESNSVRIHEISDVTVPVQFACSFADDPTSGHAVNLFQNTVTLLRMEKELFTVIWKETLPDCNNVGWTVTQERNRGGYLIVERGKTLIAIFNELGGAFFGSDRFALPIQISPQAWCLMSVAAQELAKQRLPAFYHEATYTKQDAREAGERMKVVYSLVKKIMGGPRFDWEPPEP